MTTTAVTPTPRYTVVTVGAKFDVIDTSTGKREGGIVWPTRDLADTKARVLNRVHALQVSDRHPRALAAQKRMDRAAA